MIDNPSDYIDVLNWCTKNFKTNDAEPMHFSPCNKLYDSIYRKLLYTSYLYFIDMQNTLSTFILIRQLFVDFSKWVFISDSRQAMRYL